MNKKEVVIDVSLEGIEEALNQIEEIEMRLQRASEYAEGLLKILKEIIQKEGESK